jgi:Ser-tRNA(Ala) deacylase AlaX
MTELLFHDDPYRRSCATTVMAVDPRGFSLADTVFFRSEGKRDKQVTIGFAAEAAEG